MERGLERRLVGGCQCGKLRYEIEGEPVAVVACHCNDCQTQSGSAFSMSMVVPRAAFHWISGEARTYRTQADSGVSKDCVFCGECGTRILNALGGMPKTFNVKPGTLDDTTWLRPSLHVWTDRRQPWLELPEGARSFPRNPVRSGS